MINIQIAVERQPTELTCERWVFNAFDVHQGLELRLTAYLKMMRPTKRHKFTSVGSSNYDTYRRREATIKIEDVPLPDDVIVEAKEKFMDEMKQVRVIKEW